MEIGSIYEINPKIKESIPLGSGSSLRLREVDKYGKKYNAYTASGREAIALSLKSLEEDRPDIVKKCLLPAYMCDTVFLPFVKAGWELYFYSIGKDLEAKADILGRQIEHIRPGLLFIHSYYGVDTWKPMRSLLKAWKRQGMCIMEDVTQSYYLQDAGREADYIVGSLRKWYSIPDGGFVSSDLFLPEKNMLRSTEYADKRWEILTDKWKYLYSGEPEEKRQKLKEEYLAKNRQMEEWLDKYYEINAISNISAAILEKEDEAGCRHKRNQNYRFLFEELQHKKGFRYIFHNIANDAAPLYFPIYADKREELQEFLRENRIYAPVLWPVGRENQDLLGEDESYIYSHLLALPMDQRYGEREMTHIAETLEAYDCLYNSTGEKR